MRIFLLGGRENECHREQKRKRKLVKFEDGDGGVESDRAISVDLTSCCWRALGKRACFIHGGRPTAINEKSIFLRWLTIRIPNNQTRLGFIGMLYTTAYNVANFLHKMRSNLFPVRNVDWRGRQRRRREPGLRGVCAPDDLQEQRRQQLIQGVRACGHHFPFVTPRQVFVILWAAGGCIVLLLSLGRVRAGENDGQRQKSAVGLGPREVCTHTHTCV